MKLTQRGRNLVTFLSLLAFLSIWGIAGYVEGKTPATNTNTCAEFQASQDWESAWDKGCPFTDSNGNYLYTWEPLQ